MPSQGYLFLQKWKWGHHIAVHDQHNRIPYLSYLAWSFHDSVCCCSRENLECRHKLPFPCHPLARHHKGVLPTGQALASQGYCYSSDATCVFPQAMARVLAKLPSLQSMTQRLRTQSSRVLQPVTDLSSSLDEAEEGLRLLSPVGESDAHVVVFVHGFRV